MQEPRLGAGLRQDAKMLGNRALSHPEQQDLPRLPVIFAVNRHQMAHGGILQHLGAVTFGPIRSIGGRRFGFVTMQIAPDAADQTKAIGTAAFHAGLMHIGRTQPLPGSINNRIFHPTPPT